MMRTGYISFPVSDNMGCDVCLILLPKDARVVQLLVMHYPVLTGLESKKIARFSE